MADLMRIKGGNGDVPKLDDRELGYRKDLKELYIGTDDGNIRLCGAKDKKELKDYIDSLITTLETIETTIATLEETVADINSRLDAMTTPDE